MTTPDPVPQQAPRRWAVRAAAVLAIGAVSGRARRIACIGRPTWRWSGSTTTRRLPAPPDADDGGPGQGRDRRAGVERIGARVAGAAVDGLQEIVTPFRLEVRESTAG